jgi:hypothetical protein
MNFANLISSIQQTHSILQRQTGKAVNANLTIRNWIIGFFIVEFEQHGEDRAKYGEALLSKIADKISIIGLTAPELSRYRQFYTIYPEIFGTLSQKFNFDDYIKNLTFDNSPEILGTLSQELAKSRENTDLSHINNILYGISFSHFVELLKIDDPLKRKYYELLILKTQLSIRELRREITSLNYERLGLSKDKALAYEQM